MSKISLAAALLLVASPASAALNNVTFLVSAPGFQGGGAGFESALVGALPNGYAEAGLTFTPGGASVQVKTPPSDGNGAFPFGDTSRQYVSVLGGPSFVDVTSGSSASRLSFYWGSIDAYNTVEFFKTGGILVGSLTGADVAPLVGNGAQNTFQSNRHVSIALTSGTYDYARLSSTSNSFEFDNIASGVPEPATWAMMLIGFAGLGLLSRRRSAVLTV
jgi:PEP-CTERM motif